MARYGFLSAESIVDEWNYGPVDWTKLFKDPASSRAYFDGSQDSFGAAFDATVMTDLQDVPVDIATFFSGTTFMWGLFTSSGAPQKPYYAFLAFQRLLDTPRRLAIEATTEKDMSALAGISEDGKSMRVLVTNFSHSQQEIRLKLSHLPWAGPGTYEQSVID